VVEGPAKFFYCSLADLHELDKKAEAGSGPIRTSIRMSKQGSRISASNIKYDSSAIIRRTIYSKD
jgi:hypothetical protein